MSKTTKPKIKKINEVAERFENAENHGSGGSGWHYPTPYVIAYNVKMRSFADVEGIRAELSDLQNDHYSDEALQREIWHEQEQTAQVAADDIKHHFGHDLDAYYAGRSGGWLEVDYSSLRLPYEVEDRPADEIETIYKDALKLEELEAEIKQYIKEGHQQYNEHVGSDAYYDELAAGLLSDKAIREEYHRKADELIKKAEQ